MDHAFGQTRVPAPPTRVISAGLTGQDCLLAVGVVPIAVTEWFGGQPFAQPCGPRFAKCAAMPSLFQGIDDDQAECRQIMDILHKAIGIGAIGKMRQKCRAIVVIADTGQHRKRQIRQRRLQQVIAFEIAAISQVPRRQQQIGLLRRVDQRVEDGVQSLAIKFARIARIKPNMGVSDLGYQHRGLSCAKVRFILRRASLRPNL